MEPNNYSKEAETPTQTPTPTQTAPTANPKPTEPTIQPVESKSKTSKSLTWCLAILAIVGIVAAVIFGYLYFTSPAPSPTPTPAPNQTSTSTEEIDLTDTLLKRDLDRKIATLHYVTSTEPTFTTFGVLREQPLYINGDLPDEVKIAALAYSLSNQSHTLSNEEIDAIIAERGYSNDIRENMRKYIDSIDGDTFRKQYLDTFGKELILGDEDSLYCPKYFYNAEFDIYYQDPDSGCGGTGSLKNYYYKNSYKLAGDKAYVYISVGSLNLENDTVYCDFVQKNSNNELPEVCEADPDLKTFTINNDNYNNYANYRFIFTKAADGTYYFERVEKV